MDACKLKTCKETENLLKPVNPSLAFINTAIYDELENLLNWSYPFSRHVEWVLFFLSLIILIWIHFYCCVLELILHYYFKYVYHSIIRVTISFYLFFRLYTSYLVLDNGILWPWRRSDNFFGVIDIIYSFG